MWSDIWRKDCEQYENEQIFLLHPNFGRIWDKINKNYVSNWMLKKDFE